MSPSNVTETDDLHERYRTVRSHTDRLSAGLSPEDQTIQSMPDTSPTKWHRAHTTWFFETFILLPSAAGYAAFDDDFAYLFNSYYEAAGPRHTRSARGMITRPGSEQVAAYRHHVDEAMGQLFATELARDVAELIELGLHHEQQHQELLLMDIKHGFSLNPTSPAYHDMQNPRSSNQPAAMVWQRFEGGVVKIGHDGDGFSFDNELPRHEALLHPFELADRLVTCGEWLDFIADGGYDDHRHWLSDGWHTVNGNGWRAPEYWYQNDGEWRAFTMAGNQPIDPGAPVSHISYYEADAFASWAGARLPTEFEWEHAAGVVGLPPGVSSSFEPTAVSNQSGLRQMFGELWQWTASPYTPYPGFRAAPGAVGEYNGKFMVNTWVLRGSCVATSPGHARPSYRNFFHPATRWHFSGLRLANDA